MISIFFLRSAVRLGTQRTVGYRKSTRTTSTSGDKSYKPIPISLPDTLAILSNSSLSNSKL